MSTFVHDEGGTVRCEQCSLIAKFHRFNFQNKTEEHICPKGHITETPEMKEQSKKKI